MTQGQIASLQSDTRAAGPDGSMSEGPLVSVVIPVYRQAEFVPVSIGSVLNQTYPNFEIIVVDDGSTEDVASFLPGDPRISLIRQPNSGLSLARNAGIAHSKGSLIAFLDHDDLWFPEHLAEHVKVHLQYPECGFTYADFRIVDGDGNDLGPGWSTTIASYEELLEGCGICLSTVIVKRECLDRVGVFDCMYVGAQDYDLWLKIARNYAVRKVDVVGACYRKHSSNMSEDYCRSAREAENILTKHLDFARKWGDKAATAAATRGLANSRETFGAQAFDHCRSSFRENKHKQAIQHFVNTIKISRSAEIPLNSVVQHQILRLVSK